MSAQRRRIIKETKRTTLIVGEGPTERAFLQYVKELYITREMSISVSVECGSGGSPRNVVEKAIRLRGSRGYDGCFVLVDSDVPFNADSRLKAQMKKRPEVKMLKVSPCIEGLFLKILGHSERMMSADCKRTFESRCLSADKKINKRSYVRLFPKETLEERRRMVDELEVILKAMGV